VREVRSTDRWQGHSQDHRHWRHGPPLPFFLIFVFFGVASLPAILGVLMLAALSLALMVAAVVLITQGALPLLREWFAPAPPAAPRVRGEYRRSRDALTTRYSSADLRLPGPALGTDAYRQRLLDVLKERYVRGEIALAEFEARVTQVVRDPSVKHLG
jgi:uncharacterized membrane protein